jgi:hypothetical protein
LFPSEGINGDQRLWAKIYASNEMSSGKAHYYIFVNVIIKKTENQNKGKRALLKKLRSENACCILTSLNQEAEPVMIPLAVVLTFL